MKITRTTADGFSSNFASHRGGAVPRQRLASGEPGTRDNFAWHLSTGNGERYSPRHRHNFDQIRFCLKGDMNMGKRPALKEGSIGYFPESTYYGPRESEEGVEQRRWMTVQFTGASGAMYLSLDQQREGQKALLQFGRFEDGIFIREKGEGKKRQDGFEAIWEHTTGQKVEYAQRYNEPIFINPASFAFWPAGAPGVSRKLLGAFTERETRLGIYRIESGATWTVPAEDANRLNLIFEGSGRCGAENCPLYTGIRLEPGETMAFQVEETAQVLQVTIPTWESFTRTVSSAKAA